MARCAVTGAVATYASGDPGLGTRRAARPRDSEKLLAEVPGYQRSELIALCGSLPGEHVMRADIRIDAVDFGGL